MASAPRLTALIDADVLVYQGAAAAQKDFKWENGAESRHLEEFAEVVELAERNLSTLVRDLKADAAILCFTDTGGQFRKRLYPPYKSRRKEKPEYLYRLRDHFMAEYRCYLKPGLEGDDCMGILATHPGLVPGKRVVVSVDKDMKTIPCDLYNPGKGTRQVVTEEEADYFHLFQTITGDPADEYPGCPRAGPKAAERAFEEHGPTWAAVLSVYAAKGLTESDALLQARCARILRHTDYDFKRKEPILWLPPKPA